MKRTSGLLLLALVLGSLAIATADPSSTSTGKCPWPRGNGALERWCFFTSHRPQPPPLDLNPFPIPNASFLSDESMESKQEYSSGYRPSNWRSYWWCQRYGRWNNYCYYWWWYNGRYFYYPCWGRCNRGQKVKPFH